MPLPDKPSLRTRALAERRAISATDHASRSLACATRLFTFIQSLPHARSTIAGYRPVYAEINIASALNLLALNGHVIVMPRVIRAQKELLFYRFDEHAPSGKVHVAQPAAPDALIPDILVVPLAAFDLRGHRLGYGAGHYDATLATLRNTRSILAIGAAFASQQVEAVPEEAFDQRLDIVITEENVIRIS